MSDSVAKRIAAQNKRRHAHNTKQDRCRNCGSFVSKPEPENGQVKYTCSACNRAVLEYVAR